MLTKGALEIFRGPLNPKFLATVGEDGRPNVVLIISITAPTDDHLAFGEFMIWKTKKNLLNNNKVYILAFTQKLKATAGRALFKGFVKTGPEVDYINNMDLFRYNAYTGIRSAGILQPISDFKTFRIPLISNLRGLMVSEVAKRLYIANRSIEIPEAVREKFDKPIGFKVLSYVEEDGFPLIFPTLAMKLKGDTLIFPIQSYMKEIKKLPKGTPMAVNILTLEPASYQLKGTFQGYLSTGLTPPIGKIKATEVYSASPPIPGELIAGVRGK